MHSRSRAANSTANDLSVKGGGSGPGRRARPHWDELRRELTVGGQIVKRFRLPAPNQEAVLRAFEEEGWPPRIYDPLPPQDEQCPKRRLHETIKSLNRHHHADLIRFCGDGTGQGVLWAWTEEHR